MMAEKRVSRPLDLESSDINSSFSESESLLQSVDSNAISSSLTLYPTSGGLKQNPKPADLTYSKAPSSASAVAVSTAGLQVLILLAVQNCSKNLLLRYVMQDQPKFLTSAAVIGVEAIKLVLCVAYIILVDKQPIFTIVTFLKEDWKNSVLLGVPAAAYSLQMSLEYVALANLNAAMFSVLVQSKLLSTAIFASLVLRKQLRVIQVMSLLLLTTGVMLCHLQNLTTTSDDEEPGNVLEGVLATLGIALSSGFASVYTEKVIKAQRAPLSERQSYSLAYMQVQLALVSLLIIGAYAMVMDFSAIMEYGLWQNFTPGAFLSIFNSAIGGLIVSAGTWFSPFPSRS
jgi:solute carrier family 35 (UDP-sugar transporter), member A1/2/3